MLVPNEYVGMERSRLYVTHKTSHLSGLKRSCHLDAQDSRWSTSSSRVSLSLVMFGSSLCTLVSSANILKDKQQYPTDFFFRWFQKVRCSVFVYRKIHFGMFWILLLLLLLLQRDTDVIYCYLSNFQSCHKPQIVILGICLTLINYCEDHSHIHHHQHYYHHYYNCGSL